MTKKVHNLIHLDSFCDYQLKRIWMQNLLIVHSKFMCFPLNIYATYIKFKILYLFPSASCYLATRLNSIVMSDYQIWQQPDFPEIIIKQKKYVIKCLSSISSMKVDWNMFFLCPSLNSWNCLKKILSGLETSWNSSFF